MALIKLCPNCNRRNQARDAECERCGTSLSMAQVMDAPALSPPRLTLNHRPLYVPMQLELVIGRSDRETGWAPDIDLTPYGGSSTTGISRRHVRLVWNGKWQIEDLNSSNGTYLNHRRLIPGEPLPLLPGSIIQVGKLYLVYHG
ncbi:MAG: FHA domain-containing protein [Anaerolineae bacterium]|nr:FHA domain-containing protein [Anaerolineae bacterium]